MVHPVVEKPIVEYNICHDGSVDYSTSVLVNPLVSFSRVKEFYDEQAKSLDTVLDELYASISKIQSDIDQFQSYVDQTNNSFTLLQRSVTGQLDQMKKKIESANQGTLTQLDAFSSRLDYLDGNIEQIRELVESSNESNLHAVELAMRKMDGIVEEMKGIRANEKDLYERIKGLSDREGDQDEKLDMIIQIMFPGLKGDLEEKLCAIQSALTEEIKESADRDEKLQDAVGELGLNINNVNADLTKKISEEVVRAMNAEQLLRKLIEDNTKAISEIEMDINAGEESSDARMDELDEMIRGERDRATRAEDAIRNGLSGEITRATASEDSIRTEMLERFAEITGSSDTDLRKLHEKIDTEIVDRKHSDDELAGRIDRLSDDVFGQIHQVDQDIRSDLGEMIQSGLAEESGLRKSGDESLSQLISEVSESTSGRMDALERMVSQRMDNLEQTIQELVDAVAKLTEKVEAIDGQYDDDIACLKTQVDFLSKITRGLDDAIEASVKRSTATLVTRVETLDNRLDAEIRHNRGTEDHLQDQIDELKGIDHLMDDTDFSIDEDLK